MVLLNSQGQGKGSNLEQTQHSVKTSEGVSFPPRPDPAASTEASLDNSRLLSLPDRPETQTNSQLEEVPQKLETTKKYWSNLRAGIWKGVKEMFSPTNLLIGAGAVAAVAALGISAKAIMLGGAALSGVAVASAIYGWVKAGGKKDKALAIDNQKEAQEAVQEQGKALADGLMVLPIGGAVLAAIKSTKLFSGIKNLLQIGNDRNVDSLPRRSGQEKLDRVPPRESMTTSEFREKVEEDVYQRLEKSLNTDLSEARYEIFQKGISGGVFRISHGDEVYVMKLSDDPSPNANLSEYLLQNEVANLGDAPRAIAREDDFIVMDFIKGYHPEIEELHNDAMLRQLGQKLRAMHDTKAVLTKQRSPFEFAKTHLDRLPDGPEKALVLSRISEAESRLGEIPLVPTHGDMQAKNIMKDGDELYFIDFPNAAMSSRYNDLATAVLDFELNSSQVEVLLNAYGGSAKSLEYNAVLMARSYASWAFFKKNRPELTELIDRDLRTAESAYNSIVNAQ